MESLHYSKKIVSIFSVVKCIYPHYKETEWLLLVDLDEFVWSPMNINLLKNNTTESPPEVAAASRSPLSDRESARPVPGSQEPAERSFI